MVLSPDGDINFFGIVTEVLQGNTLAPFLFIICLDYVLRMSIVQLTKMVWHWRKARSKYPAETITDEDYTDDLRFLENIPTQADSFLHSLEQTEKGIGLQGNSVHVF